MSAKKAAAKKVSAVPAQGVKDGEGQEYIVTGIVPTPTYDPTRPVFTHHPSTHPAYGSKSRHAAYEVGESGRLISVRCSSLASARAMIRVLKTVLRDVKGVRADNI